MAQKTLAQRVTALEKEVARLAEQIQPQDEPGRDDWKRTLGMFSNDPIMKIIDEETLKIREADRRRARRKRNTRSRR